MDPLQAYLVARKMTPWVPEPSRLDPKGETVAEVVSHWLACRADIFDVGLGQLRYCLDDADVEALSAHLDEWSAR